MIINQNWTWDDTDVGIREKDYKVAFFISILKGMRGNILVMNKQIGNLSKEIETIRKTSGNSKTKSWEF